MASRKSTPSDGEILEAKPTQSRSSSSSSVNRPPRRVLYSRSPSPTSAPAPSRSRTTRSRSPYRERGSKRSHEEDRYGRRDRDDPRSFRVRYEDGRDRHSHSSKHRAFEDRRRPPSRERKRSPADGASNRIRSSRDYEQARGPGRREPASNSREFHGKALMNTQAKHNSASVTAGVRVESKNEQAQQIVDGDNTSALEPSESVDAETALDVEASRAEKLKRWESIRAKHRNPAAPLLKQALDASIDYSTASNTPVDSVPASPAQGMSNLPYTEFKSQGADRTDNFLATSEVSSVPGTPRSNPSPVSTPTAMDFSNDAELSSVTAQQNVGNRPDEPSAADYDAKMDMQEDRQRHDARLQAENPALQDTTVAAPPGQEQTPAKKKDEFDMFADDDDDMFAPEPNLSAGNAAQAKTGTKALAVNTIDDWDDEEGYYRVILGELLDGRYHVQSNLGKGMFSSVVRAEDKATGALVAIKLIRANETMRKAAAKEIDILDTIKQADPEDKRHVVRLERSFEHKGHLCMVFENLNENLREVLKKFGRDVGIDLQAVRVYAQQIFKGLSLLRKCNILHADLKPDNILVNDRRTLLKICDLGSAADVSDSAITPYLVSRFYRAPEIILGMPYDFAIDTWSIGCTLFELYTGKILFTGRTNNQMLRAIMECRGRFSTKMLRKAEFAGLHFDEQGSFKSVEHDRTTNKDVLRTLNFLKPTRDLKIRLMGASRDPDLGSFLDLLDKCLTLNPERRIAPTDALKHPFLARKL